MSWLPLRSISPDGVGHAAGHRQSDAISQVVVGLTRGVSEGAKVGIERLVGDPEIGAEDLTAVGADGPIDIEQRVGGVVARVVPDDAYIPLGVDRQLGHGLAVDHIARGARGALSEVVVVEHADARVGTNLERVLPGDAIIGGARKDDYRGVHDGSVAAENVGGRDNVDVTRPRRVGGDVIDLLSAKLVVGQSGTRDIIVVIVDSNWEIETR